MLDSPILAPDAPFKNVLFSHPVQCTGTNTDLRMAVKARARSARPSRTILTQRMLARNDDIALEVLIDSLCFKCPSPAHRANVEQPDVKTIKSRMRYLPLRGFRAADASRIIREILLATGNIARTEQELFGLPGLQRLRDSTLSLTEKQLLRSHLRTYFHMFRPQCPFEIMFVNRYDYTRFEGAVFARRPIKAGEFVQFLIGTTARLSEKEETSLRQTGKDFSVVRSGNSKSLSVLLGPARFVNHDCNPNCRLITVRSDRIAVDALRDIDEGEEITVFYSNDYFGEGNRDCLRTTCHGTPSWTVTTVALMK